MAKFSIEKRDGVDYIVNRKGKYTVRVYLPKEQPASYNDFTNQVIGVWYEHPDQTAVLGDPTVDFEFIGLNLLGGDGSLTGGQWQEAINFYCTTELGFVPQGFIAHNCDIDSVGWHYNQED